MSETPTDADTSIPVRELLAIPDRKIFPFHYPELSSSNAMFESWGKEYADWWETTYYSYLPSAWRKRLFRRVEPAISFAIADTMFNLSPWQREAAITHPDLEIVSSIVRQRKLSVIEFALLMAHPKISKQQLFDFASGRVYPIQEIEYLKGQLELGMTPGDCKAARRLARAAIVRRQIFYLK